MAVAGVIVLAAAAGCGEGGGSQASPAVTSSADAAVTAAHGGTVRLAGGATLVIPPGAVSGDGHLIARTGAPREGTSLNLSGQAGTAPALAAAGNQVSFDLTGATLIHPAALTLPVDAAALQQAGTAATQADAVWLAFYDTAARSWQYAGGRYDPGTHSVSAQVTHLSLWAPFTFAWQQIGTALRGALTGLLSERANLAPCPGVTGVGISDSGGPAGPVIGCAGQADANQLTVTIANNRGYAMVVPTPDGVTPGPRQYTDYTQFLQTQPAAVQKLGGQYLAPSESLTYTMPLHGSPVAFHAAASVKTYVLDVGIILTRSALDVSSAGLSDCMLDNMASSGPLPLSAAPHLLIECLPVLGGIVKEASTALGDFVDAFFFARQYVGAVLDLNGDARSNFSGTVSVTRQSLPLPGFYYATIWDPQQVFQDPAYPKTMGIDNHDWITIQSVNTWLPGSMSMTGTLNYDNCQGGCASGQEIAFPVQITATAPQTCTVQTGMVGSTTPEEAYVYSKINVSALNGSPPSFLVGSSVFKACS